MLPVERINKIKKIISEKKQADVSTLALTLNVTEATIRRDLEKLENEQFLTRTHGGAVLNDTITSENSLFQIDDSEAQYYQNIGKVAAQFVKDNEIIFLGPGITTRYIARMLKDKINVSMVTTDLCVAHDCAKYSPNVSIIVTGGTLNPTTLQLSGPMINNSLNTFFFSHSFLDIDGVTLERGYSVSSLNKSYLIQDILRLSNKSFAVCPYTRFDTESAAVVGNINLFESIITNEHTPEKFKEYYFQHNIQIFATFNIF